MAILLQRVWQTLQGVVERPRSDADLLRQFSTTRAEAPFTQLVERHGPWVLGVAQRVLRDTHAAEDVVQATFLTLARHAHNLRHPERLAGWLHATAFRYALRLRRRPLTLTHPPKATNDVLDELSAREVFAIVDEEMARLPNAYRAVLVLCGYEGCSQEDAATRLGWSPGSVRGRLERGRKLLRERLARRGITVPATLVGVLTQTTLPDVLRATIVRCACGHAVPSATVVHLAAGGSSWMLKVAALVVLGLSVALFSVGGGAPVETPPTPKPKEIVAVKGIPEEPLPDGAVLRLGTTHQRAVNAQLAFTPDGKTIVGLVGGRYISKWDAATGERKEFFDLTKDDFGTAAISGDGRFVYYRRFNGEQRIWEVSKKDEGQVLARGVNDRVEKAAFSADGQRLAILVNNPKQKTLLVFDTATKKQLYTTTIKVDAGIYALTFSSDGRYVLASFMSLEAGTCCWDVAKEKKIWQLAECAPPYLHATNKYVYTPFAKHHVLDIATGKGVQPSIGGDIKGFELVAATPDDTTVFIVASKQITLRSWRNPGAKDIVIPHGSNSVVVAPDGQSFLTMNGELQRWDMQGKPLWRNTSDLGHTDEPTAMHFTTDGQRLVSAGRDGSVRLWDMRTGQIQRQWMGMDAARPGNWAGDVGAGLRCVDLSADGTIVAAAGTDEQVFVWNTTTGQRVAAIPLPPRQRYEGERDIDFLRLTPDGAEVTTCFQPRRSVVRAGDQPARIETHLGTWSVATGKVLRVAELPIVDRRRAAISPLEGRLAHQKTLYRPRDGAAVVQLNDATEGDECKAFSADGLLIASGHAKVGKDVIGPNGVKVWDAQTGQPVAHIKTPSWIAQLAFHPDHRFLALNDLQSVRLVDLVTGQTVWEKKMPLYPRCFGTAGSYASCLAFTNDGKRLATGMPDGSILVWELPALRSKPKPLAEDEVPFLYADVTGADSAKAWAAAWRLGDFPKDTLAHVQPLLKPVAGVPDAEVKQLVQELDDRLFAKREAATKKLRDYGLRAEGTLRAIDKATLSDEQRQRLAGILEALEMLTPLEADVGSRRLVGVLALNPEAAPLLGKIAQGVVKHTLTQQAQHALTRQRGTGK